MWPILSNCARCLDARRMKRASITDCGVASRNFWNFSTTVWAFNCKFFDWACLNCKWRIVFLSFARFRNFIKINHQQIIYDKLFQFWDLGDVRENLERVLRGRFPKLHSPCRLKIVVVSTLLYPCHSLKSCLPFTRLLYQIY